MPAGRMRERVTLQMRDPEAVANAYNEATETWVDVLTNIPAEVYAYSGREFVAAQQVQASATHRVTVRTPTSVAIRPEYRFVWVERLIAGTELTHTLDIKQVTPLLKHRGYTECVCTEHAAGG